MTVYPGNKSLDAEITLNFENGTVLMDYSLNKYGSPYSSNTSTTLYNQWKNQTIQTKIYYLLKSIPLIFISIVTSFIVPCFTFLNKHGLIKSTNAQYQYQRFLRWIYSNTLGIYVQRKGGSIDTTELIFYFPNNIFFEYKLKGDYEKQIESISLLRNFARHMIFGKFEKIRQRGWKIIFRFRNPPKDGYCEVRGIRSG
jgi:hypothetical protein